MQTLEEAIKNTIKTAELLKSHPELQSIIAPLSGATPDTVDVQKMKASMQKLGIPEITFTDKKTSSFDL